MTFTTTPRVLIVAVLAMFAFTGCAATADTTEPGATAATTAAESLTITDPWVKAADTGMSAAFGTLENTSDTDINVVSATSSSATMMELHETVSDSAGVMVMQQKEGGFIVPANGSYEMAPGANHLMMMGLTAPLIAGVDATFTLALSDGSTCEFTAPAKDYSGANENYDDSETNK